MAKHVRPPLNIRRQFLLLAAACLVLVCPMAIAQKDAVPGTAASAAPSPAPAPSTIPTPSFDVATIKVHPIGVSAHELGIDNLSDGVNGSYITLADLIEYAYGLRFDAQVAGIPDWAKNLRFDVQARMGEAHIARMAELTPKAQKTLRHQMMQSLLADRFHLTVHSETRQLPVYKLVVAKGGFKLKEPIPGSNPHAVLDKDGKPYRGYLMLFGDHMTAQAYTMSQLADLLSDPACGLGRPVIDDTALTGAYDFNLDWSPQIKNLIPGPDSVPPSPDDAVNVFSALEELGLKLQPSTGPIDIIVIDHVEHPTAN